MIREMTRYGMRISPEHFRDLSFRLSRRMQSLRHDITSQIPPAALDRFVELSDSDEPEYDDDGMELPDDSLNVDSGKKIAELLYDVLVLHKSGSVKVKKTKGGNTLSTGKKTLEQLKRDHPVIQLILDYREASKLDGTYARTMPRHAKFHPKGKDCPVCGWDHRTDEHRVHCDIMTTRTTTGRTAHKNPNLSNIPARSKWGREIRSGFIASEGCLIVDEDLSQIELRLLASYSGDENMIRIYRDDRDIHVDTAMRAFDVSEAEVTSDAGKLAYRAPCKNVNFAVAYKISGSGLLDLMGVTYATSGVKMPDHMDEPWCDSFIEKWFRLYPGAKAYMDSIESIARRHAIVWTACGRVRRIPEVRSSLRWIQEAGVRQAGNMPIQGGNAELMKLVMGECHQRLTILRKEYNVKTRALNTVYDALMTENEEDDAETIRAVIGEVMQNVLVDRKTGKSHCKVPIKSEGHCSKRWEK